LAPFLRPPSRSTLSVTVPVPVPSVGVSKGPMVVTAL
jgi:hypothetical protein